MRTRHLLALLAVAAVAGAAGSTLAATSDTVIQGCVRKDSVLTIATLEQCKTIGQPLAWNIQGPKGDPGTQLRSIDDLDGLSCVTKGATGEIAVSVGAGGDVALECVTAPQGPLVVVNEVMTASPTSAASEFVELVNAGGSAADLGGYRLVYRSSTGTSEETLANVPAGTTLDAGARYVFGGTTFWGSSNQKYNSGLAAAGGGVGLRNSAGELLDSVGYGSGTTNAFVEGAPALAPKAGASISRLPDGHDGNYNAQDFSSTSPPTPGAVNHA